MTRSSRAVTGTDGTPHHHESETRMSTDIEFSSPASTTGVDWQATKGHLLLVSPLSVEEKVNTSLGEKDAIRADVVDLDTGETFTDILVFPRVLQGQLRPKIGGKVLGRLGQGTARPGQSAPWLLQDFTPDDAKKAQAWLEQQRKTQFTAPATSSGQWVGKDSDAPF